MQYTLKNAVVVAAATLTGSTTAIAGIETRARASTYSTIQLAGADFVDDVSNSVTSLAASSLDVIRRRNNFDPTSPPATRHIADAAWVTPTSGSLTTTTQLINPLGATFNWTAASINSTIDDIVITRANGDTSPGTVRLSIVYDYTNSGPNGINYIVTMGTDGFRPSTPLARADTGGFVFAYNTTGNASDQVGMFIDLPLNTPLELFQQYETAVGYVGSSPGTYTTTASFNIDGIVFDASNPLGSEGYVFSSATLGITDSSFAIPSPGAAAPFALAGLIAARRRR